MKINFCKARIKMERESLQTLPMLNRGHLMNEMQAAYVRHRNPTARTLCNGHLVAVHDVAACSNCAGHKHYVFGLGGS